MTRMMWMLMTLRKRKKLHNFFQALVQPSRHTRVPILWGAILFTLVFLALNGTLAQGSFAQRKPSPNDCLLYATVFTPEGRAFYGAEARIHQVGKNKPAWESTSNHQGEIAVRVPTLGDYEIEVKAKGYVTQTKKVTPIAGDRVDLVFNMVPQTKKKP